MISNKMLLIAALLVLVAGYNLWVFAWHGFFYQCIAVGLLLLALLIKRLMPCDPTVTIAIWLCVNNVLDELFFDPKSFGWNEYLIAGIIIIVTIIKSRKNAGKQPGARPLRN
jgi:hypothetical protein